MKLYIRTQTPGERREHVQFDECYDVLSQSEWRAHIEAAGANIITSVLKPDGHRFQLRGKHLYTKSHPHETHYTYDPEIHASYRAAAEKLARRLEPVLDDTRRCLVYLPLRGALPIWRAVRVHLSADARARCEEYHAVTSSFVTYPEGLNIRGPGVRASGRFANILELRRLRDWCIRPMGFDHLLYVDEIISGGMMRGHVNEMMDLGVTSLLPVTVAALADSFGTRLEGERLPQWARGRRQDPRVHLGGLPHARLRGPEVHAWNTLRRSRLWPARCSSSHGPTVLIRRKGAFRSRCDRRGRLICAGR